MDNDRIETRVGWAGPIEVGQYQPLTKSLGFGSGIRRILQARVQPLLFLAFLAPLAAADNLPSAAGKPQVWFSPSFSFADHVGSADNLDLFKDSSPWFRAKARVNVFKFAVHTLNQMPDEDLANMLGFLKRNHIALAVEYGMLTPSIDCGKGVEGFKPENMASHLSERIRKFGGEIRYIAMDEPLFFGHFFNRKNACHWTIDAIAHNVAGNIRQFREIFPNVEIGDIEPVNNIKDSDWLEQVRHWIGAYQKETGTPLAFFHDDMIWREPVATRTRTLISLLDANGIKFGVILNSRGDVQSDQDWLDSATNNIHEYRAGSLKEPDQIIIQSWKPYPTHVLPESSPLTLTHMVNYYFDGH